MELKRANIITTLMPHRIPSLTRPGACPRFRKLLWFARFPVTRFHKEADVAVVEISDIRFVQTRRDRPAPFTYRAVQSRRKCSIKRLTRGRTVIPVCPSFIACLITVQACFQQDG